MPSYGQTVTLNYVAWDNTNNVGKTGDVGNHTLRWIKDGTSAAPTNNPAEVDASNAPGVYKLVMTGTEAQCQVGTLAGKSSTSGVSIIPITVTFENLPTAAPGATNGVFIAGSNAATSITTALTANIIGNVTGNLAGAVGSVTGAVTVGTNNDKTGYSLNLAQAVATSNTANTVGDCLNAARADGFGKWTLVGTTLTLYAPDGSTAVRTFTLDSATSPTQRV